MWGWCKIACQMGNDKLYTTWIVLKMFFPVKMGVKDLFTLLGCTVHKAICRKERFGTCIEAQKLQQSSPKHMISLKQDYICKQILMHGKGVPILCRLQIQPSFKIYCRLQIKPSLTINILQTTNIAFIFNILQITNNVSALH